MKGLFLKDFLVTKKTLVYMLVVTALFGGVYTSMDTNYFLTFFLAIMMVSVLLSAISYDEFYHWDRYAMTLPLSRRRIVLAKYIWSYLLFLGGTVFAVWLQLAAMYLKSQPITLEDVAVMGVAPAIGLIGTAVVLPCSYKFGVQKSRLAMLVLYGVPSLLLVLVMRLMPDLFREMTGVEFSLGGFVGGIYGVMILFQLVSIFLSVRIVERKEY